MTKKVKIALGIGSALAIAIVGIVIYNKMSKGSDTARKYLGDVDENGGNAPANDNTPAPKLTKVGVVARPIRLTATRNRTL